MVGNGLRVGRFWIFLGSGPFLAGWVILRDGGRGFEGVRVVVFRGSSRWWAGSVAYFGGVPHFRHWRSPLSVAAVSRRRGSHRVCFQEMEYFIINKLRFWVGEQF